MHNFKCKIHEMEREIQTDKTEALYFKNRNLLSAKLVVLASMVCSLHTPLQSHPTDDDDDRDDDDDSDDDNGDDEDK